MDLRLGDRFRVTSDTSVVDPRNFRGFHDVHFYNHLLLDPGEFALGQAAEEVCIPTDRTGLLFATSTYLRCGLYFGCGVVWPGWKGRLVFELGNLNKRPLKLYVGDIIAHIAFVQGDATPYVGRYTTHNPMEPLPPAEHVGCCACGSPTCPYCSKTLSI